MMRRRLNHVLLVVAVAASLALAACGGDDDSGGGSTGASPATTAGSTATAQSDAGTTSADIPVPPTSPPTEIGVTEKLSKVPPKGKTVGWAMCELGGCQTFTPGFKAAAEALGWNLKVYPYKSGAPGPALQQAISSNVDYIVITGQPPALFMPQLKAAKAKNIPIISANDVTPPDAATGLVTQFGDISMFGNEGVQLAQWIMQDSGSKAHIAYVNIPDYPILNAGYKAVKDTVAKYCPADCTVDQIALTVDELGAGKGPSKIVGYLQGHPETNYLDFSFADLLTGVQPVLKTAGLADKVKITGQALGNSQPVVKGLQDGSIAAWVAQPNYYQAWLQMDAAARLAVGDELTEERTAAKMPTWVVVGASAAQPLADIGGWDGPPGYQDKFKALWGIS
jgi:ABC-type sugar transport system substrate-binding protein